MTPESQTLLEEIQAKHPGAVGEETTEGLLAVRRPTADEVVAMEDGLARLKCLASLDDPYSGMDAVKKLIVCPDAKTAEDWLNSYPGVIEQAAGLARVAAFGPSQSWPILQSTDLLDKELYIGDNNPNTPRTKRHGGKIFTVEHVSPRDTENPFTPPKVLARYCMRRLGLNEHREALKLTAATGFMRANGIRIPCMAQLASIAKSHVCVPVPEGCNAPDFDADPYLLKLLGQAVIDSSRLTIGSAAGKSKPS